MDDVTRKPYFDDFERQGESSVRIQIDTGNWASFEPPRLAAAKEWCRLKEEERAAASSAKRDAREEETLSIARQANRLAVIAIIVSVAAIVAAIIA